jgi:hypothetical protein
MEVERVVWWKTCLDALGSVTPVLPFCCKCIPDAEQQ